MDMEKIKNNLNITKEKIDQLDTSGKELEQHYLHLIESKDDMAENSISIEESIEKLRSIQQTNNSYVIHTDFDEETIEELVFENQGLFTDLNNNKRDLKAVKRRIKVTRKECALEKLRLKKYERLLRSFEWAESDHLDDEKYYSLGKRTEEWSVLRNDLDNIRISISDLEREFSLLEYAASFENSEISSDLDLRNELYSEVQERYKITINRFGYVLKALLKIEGFGRMALNSVRYKR